MTKTLKKIQILALMLLLLLGTFACGGGGGGGEATPAAATPANALIGTWLHPATASSSNQTLTLTETTWENNDPGNGGCIETGTYTSNNTSLTFTYDSNGGCHGEAANSTFLANYTATSTTLKMYDPGNGTLIADYAKEATACSGGYFILPATTADLEGTWRTAFFEVSSDSIPEAKYFLDTYNSGGTGTGLTTHGTMPGVVGEPDVLTADVVQADGRITDPQDSTFYGALSISGNFSTRIYADNDPAVNEDVDFHVGLMPSSGLTNASLAGDYHFVEYGYFEDYTDPWAALGSITFQGDGTGTDTVAQCSRPSGAACITQDGNVTYNVDNDGFLTLNIDGRNYVASVGDNGNMIVAVDVDYDPFAPAGKDTGILLAVKKATDLTTAELDSEYYDVRYRSSGYSATAQDHSEFSDISFHGNGNVSAQDLATSDGNLESNEATYSVANDGSICIDVGDGTFPGFVSDNTELIVMMNTGNPGIEILIKKSDQCDIVD